MASLLKKNFEVIEKDINSWLQKFNFGSGLYFRELSKTVYTLNFWDSNEKLTYTNIANAGFGASQILPLIVQALLSSDDNLTIAEQPEIHLNPRLQGVLAELFCFMASKDQRIIVETHSEHLLLRLRTLIAAKKLTPDNIGIYFVEKNNGISKIKEIPIDENGRIKSEEWPVGFFDDTLKESLALASAQSKNKN